MKIVLINILFIFKYSVAWSNTAFWPKLIFYFQNVVLFLVWNPLILTLIVYVSWTQNDNVVDNIILISEEMPFKSVASPSLVFDNKNVFDNNFDVYIIGIVLQINDSLECIFNKEILKTCRIITVAVYWAV